MARRCGQGVRADVKVCVRRYAVDVRRMGLGCVLERGGHGEVSHWKDLDRDSCASRPDVEH